MPENDGTDHQPERLLLKLQNHKEPASGLALVKSIMDLHGGTAAVESSVGRGTKSP